MTIPVPSINEFIGVAVLLLMAIALIAGEADATMNQPSIDAAASAEASAFERTDVPFRTAISAQIGGQPLTISIDAVAEFNRVRASD